MYSLIRIQEGSTCRLLHSYDFVFTFFWVIIIYNLMIAEFYYLASSMHIFVQNSGLLIELDFINFTLKGLFKVYRLELF